MKENQNSSEERLTRETADSVERPSVLTPKVKSVLQKGCKTLLNAQSHADRELTAEEISFGRFDSETLVDLAEVLDSQGKWDLEDFCLRRGSDALAKLLLAAEFLEASVAWDLIHVRFAEAVKRDAQKVSRRWPAVLGLPGPAQDDGLLLGFLWNLWDKRKSAAPPNPAPKN